MNEHARCIVVKYGGNALAEAGASDPLLDEVASLTALGRPIVLVHGGGPAIDRELSRLGIATTRVDGLRVTDGATLAVTEAVLCATVNKRLVRDLLQRGVRAVGVSGQDGKMLHAVIGDRRLGFVGTIERVDPTLVHVLSASGYVPVVAPLALAPDGEALNVNADLAAAAIAVALDASAIVFATNVERVLRDPHDAASGIDEMDVAAAALFYESPGCSGGMRPKIEAALLAARGGVDAYIAEAGPRAIAGAIEGRATKVVSNRDGVRA